MIRLTCRSPVTLAVVLFGCFFGPSRGLMDNVVTPSCGAEDDLCDFTMKVTRELTLTFCQGEGMHRGCQLVKYDSSGQAYTIGKMKIGDEASLPELELDECLSASNITKEEAAGVVTGDGSTRSVMLVNRELPGPAMVVYEGQQVVVNVTNAMYDEAFTMHWHGIHQRATPWMDGAGGVSQCPISPGETFTYRFRASPAGTHWYHAHVGVQRTEGAYGPLVVLPRPTKHTQKSRKGKKRPVVAAEFHLMIQDWFQQSSFEVQKQWEWLLSLFPGGYADTSGCFDGTYTPDGAQHTIVKSQSAIINGKGHHFPENSDTAEHPGLPLEVYHVSKGDRFRFRVAAVSLAESFRISVDNHSLHVDATEDQDVVPMEVESIIITPGERFDFWIDATDPDGQGSYWIRVEGIDIYLREDVDGEVTYVRRPSVHTEAILTYTDDITNPGSQRQVCTEEFPCKILNCPFRLYPEGDHKECIPLTSLKPSIARYTNMPTEDQLKQLRPKDGTAKPAVEEFLNFQYIIGDPPSNNWISSINGVVHKPPSSPPQVTPGGLDVVATCSACPQGEAGCECTHHVHLPLDTVVYMVFLKNPHPVHFHGHSFEVIKIGYPTYDPITGYITEANEDITCLDENCFHLAWTNSSWSYGNLPGAITPGIRKDTVMIPEGGYVVVRFWTHNPGYWFLHCHMQFHNAQGMSLIVQEGDYIDMPAPPHGMKQCGDFHWTEQEYMEKMNL